MLWTDTKMTFFSFLLSSKNKVIDSSSLQVRDVQYVQGWVENPRVSVDTEVPKRLSEMGPLYIKSASANSWTI